jgi:hypothetical protein
MLKEYLCDNDSQWNNSLVAMETQSPVNDKEKHTMYPRKPPRVLQTIDLMNSNTGILCVMLVNIAETMTTEKTTNKNIH